MSVCGIFMPQALSECIGCGEPFCKICGHCDNKTCSTYGEHVIEPKELKKLDRSALDTQVGGDHYKQLGMYQPWEVLAKWLTPEELRGYGKGTVIAYLARERAKGGREDIKKAMHTLQLYLELSAEGGETK